MRRIPSDVMGRFDPRGGRSPHPSDCRALPPCYRAAEMMLKDRMKPGARSYSFEFFPPRTDEAEEALFQLIAEELRPLDPSFVSVTYGAGGSTRDRTLRIVARIVRETDLIPVAHLTTVLADEAELSRIIDELKSSGVRHILALRGDPPATLPEGKTTIHDPNYQHGRDLVELIHRRAPGHFSVGVAGHPEGHPESKGDLELDAKHLAEKVLAGADFVVTQFFFEARHYFALRERAIRHGMPPDTPILPGIMPVTNFAQIKRFAELSGAEFPAWLEEKLSVHADDPSALADLGIELATKLCEELLQGGAPGLHFYTLNKSPATRQIVANLDASQSRIG